MASRTKKTEGAPKDHNTTAADTTTAFNLARIIDPKTGPAELRFEPDDEPMTGEQRVALLAALREHWDEWETWGDDLDDEEDVEDVLFGREADEEEEDDEWDDEDDDLDEDDEDY